MIEFILGGLVATAYLTVYASTETKEWLEAKIQSTITRIKGDKGE